MIRHRRNRRAQDAVVRQRHRFDVIASLAQLVDPDLQRLAGGRDTAPVQGFDRAFAQFGQQMRAGELALAEIGHATSSAAIDASIALPISSGICGITELPIASSLLGIPLPPPQSLDGYK